MKEQFDRDGFLVLPGFFSAAEMDDIDAAVARFIREIVPALPKADAMHEDYTDPATLKQINGMEREPALDRLRGVPKVRDLVETLLGPAVAKGVEYFNKPPRVGKGTPPHQDGFYFCLTPCEALTVWIALDVADAANGAVHYVRGSHQLGVLPHEATHVLGFSQGLGEAPPERFGEPVRCAVRRGDCLVHHCRTIHFAGPNRTERTRRAIGLVYYSAAAQIDEAARQRYQESLRRQRDAAGVLP